MAADAPLAVPEDADQVLRRTRAAAIITAGPDGPPHVTQSLVHWDGADLHVSGVSWAQRTENLRRQSGVALLIRDDADGRLLAIQGEAHLIEGAEVREQTLVLLRRELNEEMAAARWAELAADGDRILIVIRPSRFDWLPDIGRQQL